MNYPDWAPDDVLKSYESVDDKTSEVALILSRLLLRPEMEKVWAWVKENDSFLPMQNGGIVGRFFGWLEEFESINKKPNSERAADFAEIKKLSLSLARKLRGYKNEHYKFNNYFHLIPLEYGNQLIHLLSEQNQQRIKNHKLSSGRFIYWKHILPPVDELLENLSNEIDSALAELSPSFPTKLRQSSARRTFLINRYLSRMPVPIVAAFLSVSLDDASLDEDTVRKAQKASEDSS